MACKSLFHYGLAAAAGVLIASSPAVAEDKAPDILAGYEKTGKTVNCIPRTRIRDQDVVDDYSIIFETSGRKLYLNELNGRCIGLAREERFSIRSPESRMCSGEIITVFDSFGNTWGSCSLGDFQELSVIEEPGEEEPEEQAAL